MDRNFLDAVAKAIGRLNVVEKDIKQISTGYINKTSPRMVVGFLPDYKLYVALEL